MNQGTGPRFLPVSERKARAEKRLDSLRAEGISILPERVTSRDMVHTVWGLGWFRHMKSLPKIGKHLARGQIYARNGSIRHLEIRPGRIRGLVLGTDLYEVVIPVLPLSGNAWQEIKDLCIGRIGSVQEIFQGNVPAEVMTRLFDEQKGICPGPKEFSLRCECAETAPVCKHAAAVLYGAGSRMDQNPELLFKLRGVQVDDLVSSWTKKLRERFEEKRNILDFEQAKDIFDLDWDE
ncbi:MAG: hypothetical protein ACLFT8_04500 [Desulfovermiculus sp.]